MSLPIERVRIEALSKLAVERVGAITDAEEKVLQASAARHRNPQKSERRPEVRSEFLRWLITDRDAANYIDPLGIFVANATISSSLELQFCSAPWPLIFVSCTFLGDLLLASAEFPTLYVIDCKTDHMIEANGLIAPGGVFLNNLQAGGELHFEAARIGNPFNCQGAKLSLTDDALFATEARFDSVFLNKGFSCAGRVILLRAQIDGHLSCYGASVSVMTCDLMQVKGDFTWVGIKGVSVPMKGVSVPALSLRDATVGMLHDDRASWPSKGRLHLVGFEYGDLVLHEHPSEGELAEESLPREIVLNADDRMEWLRRQSDVEINEPQPWMQLAKVLEAHGNAAGAENVIYEFRRQQVHAASPLVRLTTLPFDLLEEQPLGVLWPMGLSWLIGSLVFWRAHRMKAMAPTDKEAYEEFRKSKKAPTTYPTFNPVVYALENILPVVKFGHDNAWGPDPLKTAQTKFPGRPKMQWTRWLPGLNYRWLAVFRWTLILFGWTLVIILIAAINRSFRN
ncbi:MAG: hypothetical protein ROO76_13635 [Terriglobia bacterium]|nr:hypothetical protein [Terriglobia bacterium]